MIYSQTQWILTFYLYCFIGWIWECCYVSLKKRKWVNRGFLYGPWLPIYGSGAIIILFTTLPVAESIPLVFLVGMISASLLEYATGAVMERIFHVRYWDYSHNPFNLNGHICLGASLGWGLFSVILIRLVHPPVAKIVCALSGEIADATSVILAIIFSIDVTKSVQNALDFKELLEKITDGNEALERLEEHYTQLSEKLNGRSEQLKVRLSEIEQNIGKKTEYLQASIRKIETNIAAEKLKNYRKAISILERNPSAVSKKYQKALSELRKLKKDK